MTLIEGFGDEVIHFFVSLAVALIALFAWWSTYISDRPFLRTVLIVERRASRRVLPDTQGALNTPEAAAESNEPGQEQKTVPANDSNNQFETNVGDRFDNFVVNADEIQNTIRTLNSTGSPDSFDESDIGYGDLNPSDESEVVRNRRIAFFQNREDSYPGQFENDGRSGFQDGSSLPNERQAHSSDEGNITIRLKYLNDDLRLVEGRLQEQLGDFKRRHFRLELAGRKLVRLIFNGKVLQQDTKTLQNYGLFDNCVVHCLVHQPRSPPPPPNATRPVMDNPSHNDIPHHWDLGNILFAGLSVLLCLAWYGRYQYAQLYTATSTVALIGLTGMFTVSLIGMYMPNADSFRTQ